MNFLGRTWKSVRRIQWSPPLHSTLEITAPIQLHPINAVSQHPTGEMTPSSINSSSSTSTSSLPTHIQKASPPINFDIPTHSTSLFQRLRTQGPLNVITNLAGSRLIFLFTLFLFLLWTILGIVTGATQVWQIVMQNASSIQCYVSDTLLMRQQQNSYTEFLQAIGEMRSRNSSLLRMVESLSAEKQQELRALAQSQIQGLGRESEVEKINWFDKACDYVASATGSLPALITFTIGIIVWLALGAMFQFDNLWQLYINTAVAVELTFTSMFLQNVRRRHADSLRVTLERIKKENAELEFLLRDLTGDMGLNQNWIISPPKASRMERSIDIYAHVVGSGVGVLLSAIVFAVWVAIGPTLHWSDNWWLVIGTYTGLIGFIDGFVIRNVYFRQSNIVASHLSSLKESDEEIMSVLRLPTTSHDSDEEEKAVKGNEPKLSPAARFSNWMIRICAHPIAVVASVVVVVILIAVATGLRWSETGQLLCNTPTMIVEGFLLLVLFQAHNLVVVERRREIGQCLERRRVMSGVAKGIKGDTEVDGEKEREVRVEFEVEG